MPRTRKPQEADLLQYVGLDCSDEELFAAAERALKPQPPMADEKSTAPQGDRS